MSKNTASKSKRSIFIRLSKYVLQQWPLFLLALALTLGSNQLSLLGPKYSGAAIDAIELAGGVDFSAVWANIVRMLGCYLVSALLAYILAAVMIFSSSFFAIIVCFNMIILFWNYENTLLDWHLDWL